ncbi:MAG: hypothetical protein CMJ31_13780 [Phycisphaerae bacterium]|nr:hypothetical protein [Phycisphaerae bacterium]
MKITKNIMALLMVAGAAASVCAQDSVSSLGTGLPGDGPDAFAAADQIDNYIVDLVPFSTSWGTRFGLGHLHKSPNVDGPMGFFGSLISAQAISADTIMTSLDDDFAFWDTAGPGVGANNSAPTTLSIDLDRVVQQSAIFSGFSNDNNTINGSVIWMNCRDATRLYVKRVLGANNESAIGVGGAAQLGVGAIDADGNAYYRADAGSSPSINNLIRTRLCDRADATFNVLTGGSVTASDAASTDILLTGTTTTHSIPQAMPESIFGGSGLVAAPNFSSQFVFGGASPLSTSTDHLFGAGAASAVDQRGGLALTPNTFAGFATPGVATMANLAKGGAPLSGETETINVFAVDASGAPIAASRRLYDPSNTTITDNSNSFVLNTTNGLSVHHYSQTAFLGGSAQVDVQVVPGTTMAGGDLIAAVTLAENQSSRFDQDPDNYIVAFRETPGGVVQETLVAYASFVQGNKEILNGAGGTAIGELLPIDVAFAGQTGPSFSAPSIDSAGNVWFVAPFQLDAEDDADVGLFRAVYDPTDFSYDLELVIRAGFGTGTTLTGANSGVPFQIQFISISDSNSISSGAFWSSNVSNAAALGQDPANLSPADPNTNGGVVVSVDIVYDVDGDGDFEDPTAGGGNASSLDESYNSLIYIGAMTNYEPGCNPADIAAPFGALDVGDTTAFLQAFGAQNPLADFNCDGMFDIADNVLFLQAFGAGCP